MVVIGSQPYRLLPVLRIANGTSVQSAIFEPLLDNPRNIYAIPLVLQHRLESNKCRSSESECSVPYGLHKVESALGPK
jgi:hypothetical protein